MCVCFSLFFLLAVNSTLMNVVMMGLHILKNTYKQQSCIDYKKKRPQMSANTRSVTQAIFHHSCRISEKQIKTEFFFFYFLVPVRENNHTINFAPKRMVLNFRPELTSLRRKWNPGLSKRRTMDHPSTCSERNVRGRPAIPKKDPRSAGSIRPKLSAGTQTTRWSHIN